MKPVLYASFLLLLACNNTPDDAEIQQTLTQRLDTSQRFANIEAAVKGGVVTLTGQCEGQGCAAAAEQQVKEMDGVESVVNNIKEGTDHTLRTSVQTVVSKYPGVTADVAGGVVVLRGVLNRDQLQPLMTELNALRPRQIDNQLAIQ